MTVDKFDAKAIAFYLPQFHPIKENDEWWEKGFTEWTNVSRSEPKFTGHSQPRLPSELGFYDLRLPDIQEQQVTLAKEYGIFGFCFYYYWFSGRRLLERPLESFMNNKNIDFPFCVCWANENWTRRWDGSEEEILIAQEHTFENSIDFLKDAKEVISHPDYIKVDNKPVIIIYRPSIITNIKGVINAWRKIAKEWGFKDLYVGAINSFGYESDDDGFDCLIEFPPHSLEAIRINQCLELKPGFKGDIFSYDTILKSSIERRKHWSKLITLHPGVMMEWDNTPRRKNKSTIYYGCNPVLYEKWLRNGVEYSKKHPKNERFVFINAWNEWAEGTYLEPDILHGRSYLQATKSSLIKSNYHLDLKEAIKKVIGEHSEAEFLLDELVFIVDAREKVIKSLISEIAELTDSNYSLEDDANNDSYDDMRQTNVVIDKKNLNYRSSLIIAISRRLQKYKTLHWLARKIYHAMR